MKTIWKFPIQIKDIQILNLPLGAEILSIQVQDDQPCLWAEVDSSNDTEPRRFEIFGTGNPMQEDMGIGRKYLASIQMPPFVWHLYERTGP